MHILETIPCLNYAQRVELMSLFPSLLDLINCSLQEFKLKAKDFPEEVVQLLFDHFMSLK